jgi:isochorismate hydrolase
VRGAWHRQFKPVVIGDACGTHTKELHEMELEVLRIGWAKVMTTDEFLTELTP